jgi:hypothetical protein
MSRNGTTRTSQDVRYLSALAGTADIESEFQRRDFFPSVASAFLTSD